MLSLIDETSSPSGKASDLSNCTFIKPSDKTFKLSLLG